MKLYQKGCTDIISQSEPISFSLLKKTVTKYCIENGYFPQMIYVTIKQFLDYPDLFEIGKWNGEWKWMDITLIPAVSKEDKRWIKEEGKKRSKK